MTALNKTENGIDTVIFDIGRVLVDFQPDIPLNRHVPDPGLRSRLKAAVYSNPAWSEADRGILPEEEIIARFVAADPSLEKEIRAAYDWSWETIRLFPYTEDWIRSPEKAAASGCSACPIIPGVSGETTDRELRFLSLVDGVLFSYACGLIKPDPEIYRLLFKTFDIRPERAVFLDDNRDNILAAEREGLHAILFTDYSQASEQLEAILSGEPAACQPRSGKKRKVFLRDLPLFFLPIISAGSGRDPLP